MGESEGSQGHPGELSERVQEIGVGVLAHTMPNPLAILSSRRPWPATMVSPLSKSAVRQRIPSRPVRQVVYRSDTRFVVYYAARSYINNDLRGLRGRIQ
jgi:hypothetical protein